MENNNEKEGNVYTVEQINKSVNAGKKHRERFEKKWARCVRKYNGALGGQRKDWQSTLSVPLARSMVEQMVADEMDMLYGQGAPFKVLPAASNWVMGSMREGDFIAAADKVDKFCTWQISNTPERNRKFENGARWKYLVGTKIFKIYNMGAPDFKNVFDEVNPYSFIIEPGATSIRNAKWVCQELLVDKTYVKTMFETGIFTEMEGFESGGYKAMLSDDEAKTPHSKEMMNEFGGASSIDNNTIDYKDKVNMYEYWENNRLVVILNCKYKVRDEENPYRYESVSGKVYEYKPYVASTCNNTADEFWGEGFLDAYVDMLDSYDLAVNMQIDAAKMSMNPMRFVTKGSGLSGTIDYFPGRSIAVRSLDEIRSEQYETARAAAKDVEFSLRNKIEGNSGQTGEWAGRTTPSTNDTALGVSVLVDRASKRMQFYIKKEIDLIKEFGDIWLCLDRKFIDSPKGMVVKKKYRSMGTSSEFPFTSATQVNKTTVETIEPADLAWDMEVVVEAPWSAPNEMAFQQNMTQAFQNLKGLPEVDATVLIKNYIKALKFPEPEGLVLEGQEIVDHALEQAKLSLMVGLEKQKIANTVAQGMQGQMVQPGQAVNPNVVSNVPATGGVPGENQFTGA